jgi:hypothetical protein
VAVYWDSGYAEVLVD